MGRNTAEQQAAARLAKQAEKEAAEASASQSASAAVCVVKCDKCNAEFPSRNKLFAHVKSLACASGGT
eukprot:6939536-Pyramimonas_sp.AAC.3